MNDLLKLISTKPKHGADYAIFNTEDAYFLTTHNSQKHLITHRFIEPVAYAVEYKYDSILRKLCEALGWQGGTIHQVVEEVKRLKALDTLSDTSDQLFTEAFESIKGIEQSIQNIRKLVHGD